MSSVVSTDKSINHDDSCQHSMTSALDTTAERAPAVKSDTDDYVDSSLLRQTVLKLLDKAGKDPRLTPRLLRNKAEQRMKLAAGTLKPFREHIKEIVMDWYYKERGETRNKDSGKNGSSSVGENISSKSSTSKTSSSHVNSLGKEDDKDKKERKNDSKGTGSDSVAELKQLIKFVKAMGEETTKVLFNGLTVLPTNNDKALALRQRLRARGYVFGSAGPTMEDVARMKAQREQAGAGAGAGVESKPTNGRASDAARATGSKRSKAEMDGQGEEGRVGERAGGEKRTAVEITENLKIKVEAVIKDRGAGVAADDEEAEF